MSSAEQMLHPLPTFHTRGLSLKGLIELRPLSGAR